MIKKREIGLAKKKKLDREQRRLRIKVRTQMDNAVYAFMYAVESHNLEVEKRAENYLIGLLFDPDNLEKCEKAIRAGEKSLEEPIRSSRNIARKAVKLAWSEKKTKVSQHHVEKAIESQHLEVWPYCRWQAESLKTRQTIASTRRAHVR